LPTTRRSAGPSPAPRRCVPSRRSREQGLLTACRASRGEPHNSCAARGARVVRRLFEGQRTREDGMSGTTRRDLVVVAALVGVLGGAGGCGGRGPSGGGRAAAAAT